MVCVMEFSDMVMRKYINMIDCWIDLVFQPLQATVEQVMVNVESFQ